VIAGWRNPPGLEGLDNDFDASTPCIVARRASVAQGRALLSVWDRSFSAHYSDISTSASVTGDNSEEARKSLKEFQTLLRNPQSSAIPELAPNAHFAPIWGVVSRALDLPLEETVYLFLFSHARTVISAGVRASVLGPYQAQTVLASGELQERIKNLINESERKNVEEAGQTIPSMDLWIGRHEKLYSRIFNS
jgi:urease accessory protein